MKQSFVFATTGRRLFIQTPDGIGSLLNKNNAL